MQWLLVRRSLTTSQRGTGAARGCQSGADLPHLHSHPPASPSTTPPPSSPAVPAYHHHRQSQVAVAVTVASIQRDPSAPSLGRLILIYPAPANHASCPLPARGTTLLTTLTARLPLVHPILHHLQAHPSSRLHRASSFLSSSSSSSSSLSPASLSSFASLLHSLFRPTRRSTGPLLAGEDCDCTPIRYLTLNTDCSAALTWICAATSSDTCIHCPQSLAFALTLSAVPSAIDNYKPPRGKTVIARTAPATLSINAHD